MNILTRLTIIIKRNMPAFNETIILNSKKKLHKNFRRNRRKYVQCVWSSHLDLMSIMSCVMCYHIWNECWSWVNKRVNDIEQNMKFFPLFLQWILHSFIIFESSILIEYITNGYQTEKSDESIDSDNRYIVITKHWFWSRLS